VCDKDAVDGSAIPFGVLYCTTDTTAEDKTVVIYLQGSFNEDKLVFAAGTVLADKYTELRHLNLMAFATIII